MKITIIELGVANSKHSQLEQIVAKSGLVGIQL
jgi:hypothetical protein